MKNLLLILILGIPGTLSGQTRTIHVFVALCDNVFQGIIPVPEKYGNGKDPINNLYWGAAYGVKTYFKNKTADWQLVKIIKQEDPAILERVLFKHVRHDIYLLADAYDGEKISLCIGNFLKAANGKIPVRITSNLKELDFGGEADLLAYAGHDGLMDFTVSIDYQSGTGLNKEVMILACFSKRFFSPEIRKAGAAPVLWTTHLMAPEAYTLKAAIDGWIILESGAQIEERAAQAYNQYQHCGINGARNLFTTGY